MGDNPADVARRQAMATAVDKELDEKFKALPKTAEGYTVIPSDRDTFARLLVAADRDGDGVTNVTELSKYLQSKGWVASQNDMNSAMRAGKWDVGADGLGVRDDAYVRETDGKWVQTANRLQDTGRSSKRVPEEQEIFLDPNAVMVRMKDGRGDGFKADLFKMSARTLDFKSGISTNSANPDRVDGLGAEIRYVRVSQVAAKDPNYLARLEERFGESVVQRDFRGQRGRIIHRGDGNIGIGDLGGAYDLTQIYAELERRDPQKPVVLTHDDPPHPDPVKGHSPAPVKGGIPQPEPLHSLVPPDLLQRGLNFSTLNMDALEQRNAAEGQSQGQGQHGHAHPHPHGHGHGHASHTGNNLLDGLINNIPFLAAIKDMLAQATGSEHGNSHVGGRGPRDRHR